MFFASTDSGDNMGRMKKTDDKKGLHVKNNLTSSLEDKPKVYIFSHTHWDSEWYKIYESFNLQLIPLMDINSL